VANAGLAFSAAMGCGMSAGKAKQSGWPFFFGTGPCATLAPLTDTELNSSWVR